MIVGVLNTSTMHSAEPDIAAWQDRSRLTLTRGIDKHLNKPRMQSALSRWQANAEQALSNAKHLLADSAS
jgi:hypothetical protein